MLPGPASTTKSVKCRVKVAKPTKCSALRWRLGNGKVASKHKTQQNTKHILDTSLGLRRVEYIHDSIIATAAQLPDFSAFPPELRGNAAGTSFPRPQLSARTKKSFAHFRVPIFSVSGHNAEGILEYAHRTRELLRFSYCNWDQSNFTLEGFVANGIFCLDFRPANALNREKLNKLRRSWRRLNFCARFT